MKTKNHFIYIYIQIIEIATNKGANSYKLDISKKELGDN